jgi:hypothetical protein
MAAIFVASLATVTPTTTALADASASDVSKSTRASNPPLRLVYFHSPSCNECKRVKNFLPQVTERWGNRIALELRSVDNLNVFNELLKYEKHSRATVDGK